MINIILFEPEIPPNTGNIIRLCANTGFALHLIKPLGFSLDNKQLRRAGLDYREFADIHVYESYDEFIPQIEPATLYACTTKASTLYTQAIYKPGDSLIFGPESRGLPATILDTAPTTHKIKIPMQSQSRSLNLSNAVAIIAFEAWRQLNFAQP